MKKFLLSTLCCFLIAQDAFSAVAIPETMKQAMKGTPETPSLINLVASLLIVIVLIYFVGWIYTRLSHLNAKSIFKPQKAAEINKPKIISGITLGQNRNIYVVELNGKYLVLGVTPNNVNLIKEFDKTDISDTGSIIEKAIVEEVKEKQEERPVDVLFKDIPQKTEQEKEIEDICKKYM